MPTFLFAMMLIMHGIGHCMGFLAAWTTVPVGFTTGASWVLSPDVTVDGPVGKAFGLLWLVAMAVSVGAGWGLMTGQDWWRQAAVVSAVLSLLVFVPWMGVTPSGSIAGAVVFDLLILGAFLPSWGERVARFIQ